MCPHCLLPLRINLEIYHPLCQRRQREEGRLTVAVKASKLLPLRGQHAEALEDIAAATTSSGSLGSSWTWALTRGSTPSPPKCGREKKASQREILPRKPASSSGGNPQRHRPDGGLERRQPLGPHVERADWLAAGSGAGPCGTLPLRRVSSGLLCLPPLPHPALSVSGAHPVLECPGPSRATVPLPPPPGLSAFRSPLTSRAEAASATRATPRGGRLGGIRPEQASKTPPSPVSAGKLFL